MNLRAIRSSVPAVTVLAAAGVAFADTTRNFSDPAGDAVIRRTDCGNDGPLRPDTVPPDLIDVRLSGWTPTNPAADLYTGTLTDGRDAHILRLDVDFAGLVNPPGTIGLGGLPYDPFRFGPSPVLGFLELNIDRDRDTGGELGGAANLRCLANVARFGALPSDSINERVATSAADLDGDFYTAPQIERSGEEFSLVLCGCHDVTIVSQDGDGDSNFDAGETWVVRSRFFQRAGGYQGASAVFGGSAGGLYDPMVNLRFRHDTSTDVTTITLVYPLDMTGAAMLAGTAVQPADSMIDINGNQSSIEEALLDIIDGADGLHGTLYGPVATLTDRWRGQRASDYLDPTDWRANAIFGTAYATPQDALYVWTDAGFEDYYGDLDGDGLVGPTDEGLVQAYITANDGGPDDADGAADGAVTLPNFGCNFSLYDVDGDGVVGPADLAIYTPACPADRTGDGVVDVFDLLAFLSDWFAGNADLDGSGATDVFDLLAYLSTWFAGCP